MTQSTQQAINQVDIPEGTLVILSGPAGAGKSSLKANLVNAHLASWISSDETRDAISPPGRQLIDGKVRLVRNMLTESLVTSSMRARVAAGLQLGRTVIIDMCNLTDRDRNDWISLANSYGAEHLVLILDTPEEECLRAAAARSFYVPRDHIAKMVNPPVPPVQVRNGIPQDKQVVTAPQGFMLSSRFKFQVVNRDTVIRCTLRELPEGAWDVIGDVHGLFNELKALLTKAGWPIINDQLMPHPENRKVLFLGDLVDRGPDSVKVVQFVQQAHARGLALSVKGNHEAKLVQFIREAQAQTLESWSSYANAETGMQFMALPAEDRDSLIDFLNKLPGYYVDEHAKTVFMHANAYVFEPGYSVKAHCIYGLTNDNKDYSLAYQEAMDAGINKYTAIHGHLPQTSVQSHVFSLDRHAFQKGELVLLQFDKVRTIFADDSSSKSQRIDAVNHALITQAVDFDFEQYSAKYAPLKTLSRLEYKKLVVSRQDKSGLFTVFKYSKRAFWDNSWGESPMLLKARGIVFDRGGKIVAHPFDKVFNYLENGTGAGLADNTKVVMVDKLNGFLGIVSKHPLNQSQLLVHTQGSFEGPPVEYLYSYLTQDVKRRQLEFFKHNDVTLMFEVLHRDDPHIISCSPEMEGLYLVGVRGKNFNDLEWTEEQVDEVANQLGHRRPAWRATTFGAAKQFVKSSTIEGYLIRKDNATQTVLLKMKSPYYLTTKFLSRMSDSKIAHMYSKPESFKTTIDEEFYVIVDKLITSFSKEELMALKGEERTKIIRNLISSML